MPSGAFSFKAKMTYLQSHSRSVSRQKRLTIGILVFLAAIVALVEYAAPHFFPALAMSVARPYWRTEFSLASGSLAGPEALLRENEDLKRQLADAAAQTATVRSLQTENDELRSLLGRASTTPYTLAAVLMRPPFSGYDELVIDAGLDQGFADNDVVYAPGNIPIGTISDVLGQTSKVTLYSSAGQKYPILIGSLHVPATAAGRGGGQYEAQLPRDAKVGEGDIVLAPQTGDKPIGIVTAVMTDPAEPFETVLFAPPINLYSLRWVLVGAYGRKP